MEKEAKTYRWQVSEKMLREIVEVIRKEVDPEMIIMFGSRARGENRPDADLDLIVIQSEPFEEEIKRFKEIEKLYLALYHFDVPKDILVYGKDELQKFRNSLNHILAEGLKEGRVLYEKP